MVVSCFLPDLFYYKHKKSFFFILHQKLSICMLVITNYGCTSMILLRFSAFYLDGREYDTSGSAICCTSFSSFYIIRTTNKCFHSVKLWGYVLLHCNFFHIFLNAAYFLLYNMQINKNEKKRKDGRICRKM